MKNSFIYILFAMLISVNCKATDSNDLFARAFTQIINEERSRVGIDTLEYEADIFCFATDWADSTDRYFNKERNEFSREIAHRLFDQRVEKYERERGAPWDYFGECIGSTRIEIEPRHRTMVSFARGFLNSKDHYRVLINPKYKRIRIGISDKYGGFAIAVFVSTEWK